MKNSLNTKPEWRVGDGAIFACVTFVAITLALSYLSWHLQIPFTKDIAWSSWPELPKAIGGYLLSILGIKTQYWLNIEALLNLYDHKTMFMWHFYMPLIFALPISIYVGYLCAKPVDQYHARGAILLFGSEAVKYARRYVKKFNKKNNISSLLGLLLHPLFRMAKGNELKGIAVVGSPNSGKTQIISGTLLDTVKQQPNAKILLLDNKGDYTELFSKDQSIILAPWDKRSEAWDIAKDILNEADAGLLAHAMIPKVKGENAIFSDASRVALIGYIVCLQRRHGTHWDWRLLVESLEWSIGYTLTEFQKYYPSGLKIFREDSKSSDSVEFTLMSNLSYLRQLAQAWPSTNGGFSLREWIKDDSKEKPILLLQVSKAYPTISDTYTCAVINVLSQLILSPTYPDCSSRRIHFVLDEIAQIPYVEQLKNLVALGRSKGVSIWLGIQDFDLLIDNYGQHEVNSLIGMMQTKIFLSMGSGTGAETVSKLIGDREIFTENFDENGSRIPLTQTQRLVAPSEISQLRPPTLQDGIQGWMTITGCNAVLRLTWPIIKFNKIRKGVELAEWINNPTVPVSSDSDSGKKRLVKKHKDCGEGL